MNYLNDLMYLEEKERSDIKSSRAYVSSLDTCHAKDVFSTIIG